MTGPDRRSVLLIIAAMAAFSLMPVFSRGAGVGVIGLAAWRAIFVAASFGLLAFRSEARTRPDRETLRLGGYLGLAQAVASATFVGGYALTTVANTIFFHNLAPVVVFPLAYWLFRERPKPSATAGAALAVLGISLLSGVSLFQFAHFANPRFLLGDLLALASAGGYAAVLVGTRATRTAKTPLYTTLAIAWGIAAVVLGLLALVSGSFWIGWGALPWVLGLALVSTTLPFTLLNLGMRKVEAGTAAVLSLSEVVFTTLVGLLFFGEGLSPLGWLGGLLAGLGVAYAAAGEPRGPAAAPATLPAALVRPRSLRAGLGLVLLNAGAVAALLARPGAPELLVWVGLLLLARLGPSLLGPGVLGVRGPQLVGALGALLAGGALAGLMLRGGELGGGDPLVLGLALAAAFVHLATARAEGPAGDPAHPITASLFALALAGALALLDHPRADLALLLAQAGLATAALTTVVGGFRGALTGGLPPDGLGPERVLARQGPRRQALLALGLLACLWLAGGVRAIPLGSVGIVERFGAPLPETQAAGLSVRLPPPIERLSLVDLRTVRRLELVEDGARLLCGDQALIVVSANLHYRVADPLRWSYGSRDVQAALAAVGRAALVETLARRSHEDVLSTERLAVEAEVHRRTTAAAEGLGLGVIVEGVQLAQAAVPAAVLPAFLEVISAAEERQTRINTAEAYAARLLPQAGGAAVARTALAHADAHLALARAEADRLRLFAWAGTGPLTRERLRWERLESALAGRSLVLAPSTLQLWLGGTPPAGTAVLPPAPK